MLFARSPIELDLIGQSLFFLLMSLREQLACSLIDLDHQKSGVFRVFY